MAAAKSNWSKTETTHLLNILKELSVSLLRTFIHTLLLFFRGRGSIEMFLRDAQPLKRSASCSRLFLILTAVICYKLTLLLD